MFSEIKLWHHVNWWAWTWASSQRTQSRLTCARITSPSLSLTNPPPSGAFSPQQLPPPDLPLLCRLPPSAKWPSLHLTFLPPIHLKGLLASKPKKKRANLIMQLCCNSQSLISNHSLRFSYSKQIREPMKRMFPKKTSISPPPNRKRPWISKRLLTT